MARRKISGVYAITNVLNGKVYIGSSVDIYSRWSAHRSSLRKNAHHSAALQRAWVKYGEDSFRFEIVEIVESPSVGDLHRRETHHIAKANSANGKDGYNSLIFGGSALGFKHTDEVRRKMSEGQKKIPKEIRLTYCRSFLGRSHTAETKAKISANSKRVSPSPEQREAISKVHKGKIIPDWHKAISAETCRKRNGTEEHRAKVSAALKGRILTPEHKAKLSAAMAGKVLSESHREKVGAASRGKPKSPEHNAKNAAAQRERWARIKAQKQADQAAS